MHAINPSQAILHSEEKVKRKSMTLWRKKTKVAAKTSQMEVHVHIHVHVHVHVCIASLNSVLLRYPSVTVLFLSVWSVCVTVSYKVLSSSPV